MFYPVAIETAGTWDDRQTDSETYHSHTVLFVIGPVTEAVTGPMTNSIVYSICQCSLAHTSNIFDARSRKRD